MGTPEYMAPEQASGKPADARSDVYAVGAILYEMLSGKPPYEGDNFMEILHKKANGAPAALSTVRNDVPPALENVIMKAMAKEPEARQQSMEALEKELQNVATLLFSNFAIAPLSEPDPTPPPSMLGALLRDAASPRSLAERVRGWNGKKVVMAGAAFGLMVAFVVVGATSAARRSGGNPVVAAPAQPAPVAAAPVAPAPPVVPPPALPTATASPPAVAEAKPADEQEETTEATEAAEATEAPVKAAGDGESGTKTKAATKVASSSGAETKKLLVDAERLLRAERFGEAREIFEKLAKSKRERGPALVGLAEISFQEKKYGEAARTAEKAAERGGGVKARVLLGDAHFRLARYKEAAKAYEDALKIEPDNASAKSGLALATKRM